MKEIDKMNLVDVFDVTLACYDLYILRPCITTVQNLSRFPTSFLLREER